MDSLATGLIETDFALDGQMRFSSRHKILSDFPAELSLTLVQQERETSNLKEIRNLEAISSTDQIRLFICWLNRMQI
jgi:hypothetical protein